MANRKQPFKDDKEISELVSAFEKCAFHPSAFRHHQHLAVALWYVSNFPYEEAAERMKRGIRRLAEPTARPAIMKRLRFSGSRSLRTSLITNTRRRRLLKLQINLPIVSPIRP